METNDKTFSLIIDRLKSLGITFEVIEHSPVVTIDDVICVLDIPTDAMAKTMLFKVNQIGLVAVILPGLNKVDYSKLATALGVKRKAVNLMTKGQADELGVQVGAISPLSGLYQRVLLDPKLFNQEMVYCGSGDLSKTIKIAPATIVNVTSATVVDVSR